MRERLIKNPKDVVSNLAISVGVATAGAALVLGGVLHIQSENKQTHQDPANIAALPGDRARSPIDVGSRVIVIAKEESPSKTELETRNCGKTNCLDYRQIPETHTVIVNYCPISDTEDKCSEDGFLVSEELFEEVEINDALRVVEKVPGDITVEPF
jgi:hypothetical protein